LLFTIADSTLRAKTPAPPSGGSRISGMRKLAQILKNLLRRRGVRTMKTHTSSRLWTTLFSIFVIVAALLNGATRVLADPSPWTQTTQSDFGGGTATNVVVVSGTGDDGSVILNTTTGNWLVDPNPDLTLGTSLVVTWIGATAVHVCVCWCALSV
jgi:hypothetical protein